MDQEIQMPEQHQHLNKLLGFNYTIVYKPSKKNNVANALSRIKEEQEVEESVEHQLMVSNCVFCALSTVTSQLLDSLRNVVLKNPKLQVIVQDCTNSSTLEHTLKDGLLYFKNKLRLTFNSSLKLDILHEFHNTPMGGHEEILKTF